MYYCITLLHNPARGGPPAPKSLSLKQLRLFCVAYRKAEEVRH